MLICLLFGFCCHVVATLWHHMHSLLITTVTVKPISRGYAPILFNSYQNELKTKLMTWSAYPLCISVSRNTTFSFHNLVIYWLAPCFRSVFLNCLVGTQKWLAEPSSVGHDSLNKKNQISNKTLFITSSVLCLLIQIVTCHDWLMVGPETKPVETHCFR